MIGGLETKLIGGPTVIASCTVQKRKLFFLMTDHSISIEVHLAKDFAADHFDAV